MNREPPWSGIGNDSAGHDSVGETERSRVPLHPESSPESRSGIGNDSVRLDSVRLDPVRSDSSHHRGRMTRLPAEYYRAHAFVHWNMAIDDRATGWLTPVFHARFREIQLHTLARHRLVCLVYCLMPDHLHLLWAGLSPDSDQDRAATFFRRYLNQALADHGMLTHSAPARGAKSATNSGAESVTIPSGPIPSSHGTQARSAPYRLQKQAWDVVLRDHDLERHAIERLLFYITANPVRARLVNDARHWPYSGTQAAGYPELDWRQVDFPDRLWKIYWRERDRHESQTERSRVPLQDAVQSAPGAGADSARRRSGIGDDSAGDEERR